MNALLASCKTMPLPALGFVLTMSFLAPLALAAPPGSWTSNECVAIDEACDPRGEGLLLNNDDRWATDGSVTTEPWRSNVTLKPVAAPIPGTNRPSLRFDTDGVNQRNEIVLRGPPYGVNFYLGHTYWHGFALYFPSGYGWEGVTSARVVSQLHARNELTYEGSSNPGISIWAKADPNDNTKILLSFNVSAHDGNMKWSDSADLGSYSYNQSIKIVTQFKMHWDITQGPFVKVWVNDVLLYDKTVRTYYRYVPGTSPGDEYQYLKRGIYDYGTRHVLRMYSEQERVGGSASSYSDVVPRF